MYLHPCSAADSDLRHNWLPIFSVSGMAVYKKAKEGWVRAKQVKTLKR
jgi:hypothetical protein